ncbi:MAG: 3-deoxy-manno-octulosonate cytidylyltransferase synthetase [Verrucomicrobiota bacterium]|jgi:3-deoxy-manno-octulosonate cytidylyltransferase (CMP-KDO synthetase)|nr:3-deoxy-manno-octulosonate cytidylyltransferase synthetase [Verrucomicrobiota bacterium]
MPMSKIVGIIPARWGSTRFPGKALHGIAGKPLIRHVWERCLEADCLDQVVIATDDMRIAEVGFNFGAEVAVTAADHPSGTDRVAEVTRKLKKASIILNIQGDEPLVDPALLRRLVRKLQDNRNIPIITAATPISPEELLSENNVKVVMDRRGDALYFSRSAIPFRRGTSEIPSYKHLGIYGYRRKALLEFVRMSPGSLEQAEQLEQLRALENGLKIRVVVSETGSIGVDTPEDATEVERLILSRRSG